MDDGLRVILIGGTSHTGKTTLARRLAERPGWAHASTDMLARHPGRPWPAGGRTVPAHVAEHYGELETEALIASVLAHYATVWPQAEALIRRHAENPTEPRLVLEGSALWPNRVAALDLPTVSAIWLVGEPPLLRDRIPAESRHAETDQCGRRLIDRFIARAIAFDAHLRMEIERLGLRSLNATDASPETVLAGLSPNPPAGRPAGHGRPATRRPGSRTSPCRARGPSR